jgi:hypothetical protein
MKVTPKGPAYCTVEDLLRILSMDREFVVFRDKIPRKRSRILPVLRLLGLHAVCWLQREKPDDKFGASWCYVQSFVLYHLALHLVTYIL